MTPFSDVRPSSSDSSAQTLSIAAFAVDADTRRILDMTLEMEGYETAHVAAADLTQVTERYRQAPMPDILIVDISTSLDAVTELKELAALCPPSIRVYAIGSLDSIDLYRRLSAIGVVDYLAKPVSPDQLLDMLARAKQAKAEPSVRLRSGKVIAVIGMRGGVGASSLAINFGWGLAQLFQRQTNLVDMDVSGGSLAIDLNAQTIPGFSDRLAKDQGQEGPFPAFSSASITDKLTLIAPDVQSMAPSHDSSVETTMDFIRRLSHQVSFAVLDLPAGPPETLLPLLKISDRQVLVMDRRLACLRDTAEMLTLLSAAPDSRTDLVLNQTRPLRSGDMTMGQIAETIGQDIAVEIPFEKCGLISMSASPKPIVMRRGARSNSVRAFIARLTGMPPKRTRLARLPGFRKRRHVR